MTVAVPYLWRYGLDIGGFEKNVGEKCPGRKTVTVIDVAMMVQATGAKTLTSGIFVN